MNRRIVDAHNHPNWCGKTSAGIVADMDKILCRNADRLARADKETQHD